MIQTNISTAKSQLSRLLERVKAGEEVTISDRDEPIAILTSYRASADKGRWSGRIAALTKRGQLRVPKTTTAKADLPQPMDVQVKVDLAGAIIEERRNGR
jgi:prevent-host-death family protein